MPLNVLDARRPPHTHKMADSADESLKLLFSEDRIMYMAVLSTFATRKSKWQTYCFGFVSTLNRVLKVRSTFPAYLMVSGPHVSLNVSFYNKGCFYEQIAPGPFGSGYGPISKQKHPTHLLTRREEN